MNKSRDIIAQLISVVIVKSVLSEIDYSTR